MRRSDITEAGDVIRRVLEQIDAGDLDATPGLRARLEGALAALDELSAPRSAPGDDDR